MQALFTVFDGHGKEGDLCAMFCKDTLPGLLAKDLRETRTVEDGLKKAFNRTNDQVSVRFNTFELVCCRASLPAHDRHSSNGTHVTVENCRLRFLLSCTLLHFVLYSKCIA